MKRLYGSIDGKTWTVLAEGSDDCYIYVPAHGREG